MVLLVAFSTGATDVTPFSHQIRKHTAEEVKAMANGLKDEDVLKAVGPTTFAHCDNSKDGALTVLKDKVSGEEFEKRKKGHWGIINVWRPLGRPVTRDALAMLDSQTLLEDDLIGVKSFFPRPGQGAFDSAYDAGEGFETAQVRANDDHRWYFASELQLDESLVFKQYDSKTDGRARQTAHTAFKCESDYGPPRQSIEVRALLFWDGESED